jgi:hypothetical protein
MSGFLVGYVRYNDFRTLPNPDDKKKPEQMALQLRYDLGKMIGVEMAGNLGSVFPSHEFQCRPLAQPAREKLFPIQGHAGPIQYAALHIW